MDRYAEGDVNAFSELYDLIAPPLLAFARRWTRDRAAAEDVVQQTFLRMHCARDGYTRGANVRPWAYAIARRLMIDGFRSAHTQDALREPDEHASLDRETPDAVLESKRLEDAVRRVLRSLPKGQREAFDLVRKDGLSCAEAGEVLGVSENAIKVRVHRAYEALRSEIRKENA
jgi:RNA polymerase sigma-70 factor (ECF subfamily)